MKSLLWKATAKTLAMSSIFSIGCFDWCPFCNKDDQKFSPKPAYSLNKLDATSNPTIKAQVPGAGAVSIPENPLDGQPIAVSNTPKAIGAPSPIATSNPVSDIAPVNYSPEKPNQKVHTISAPEQPNVPMGSTSEAPNLGIPATSLAPGLSPIQELTKTSEINQPVKQSKPATVAGPESVIIPPPPGLPGLKQTPPTTVISPGGTNLGTTPIGIPTPPSATPYR